MTETSRSLPEWRFGVTQPVTRVIQAVGQARIVGEDAVAWELRTGVRLLPLLFDLC